MTTTTLAIVPLTESQFEQAAGALTRAFCRDPAWYWVLPDPTTQCAKLEALMTIWCRYGCLFGEGYTTAGQVAGAAIWIPPDRGDFTPEREATAGFGGLTRAWRSDELARFDLLADNLGELHHRLMPSPHWYLWVVCVDPSYQGQGIGSALMQPGFRRADTAGLPCYLETQNLANVRLYQRHGFEVVAETDTPGGGPHFWLMARQPHERSASDG